MHATLSELADFAAQFVRGLPNARGAHAHIIGLSGELGAGKTTFAQLVAKELGVRESVQSPTFTIVKTYPISHTPFTTLVHIDAYRITERDAAAIGWDGYAANPENLILVEWPENLGRVFPNNAPRIEFKLVDDETRRAIAHHAGV